MTTLRRLASALTLTLCILALSAHAQTPAIEVTSDAADQPFAQSVRLQVFSPAGELVFEAETTGTQPLRWPMVNQKGARVPDGLYRAHITSTDSSGKLSTRTEDVTVNEQARAAAAAAAPTAPQDALAPTGAGTAGRLAKWTSSTNLGNSVVTESASRLGVNIAAPTATLHLQGLQPAAVATNGTNATTFLQTTGGKGGNTTAAGKTGGKGASIVLTAGQGGNAVAGATNGSGGSIILQPGSAGTGGAYGPPGKVLIAPNGIGSVNIGSSALVTESKLYVQASVGEDVAVWGNGNSNNSVGVYGSSISNTGVYGQSESGRGVWGFSATGSGVTGTSPGGHAGYFFGKVTVSGNVGIGANTPLRPLEIATGQLRFTSANGDVEFTEAADLLAHVTTASPAASLPAFRVHRGSNVTPVFTVFNSGNAEVAGTLKVTGGSCTGCSPPSDKNLKANISSINPRLILDKLAALPIQTWNYKTEPETVRHLGPMAQDFRAAFGLGESDRTLNTVDAQGVALASIQALYQLMLEREKKNEQLADEVRRLRAQVMQQQSQLARQRAQLNRVKRIMTKNRAARR